MSLRVKSERHCVFCLPSDYRNLPISNFGVIIILVVLLTEALQQINQVSTANTREVMTIYKFGNENFEKKAEFGTN